MKIYIKTYGCQMNERDSDAAAAMLAADGHTIVSSEEQADLILLNTCSVRDQAERKAVGKLGILKRLKEEHPHLLFGIMGCMAQRCGEELLKTIPHLNFAVGTDRIHELPEIVASLPSPRRIAATGHDNLNDVDGIDAHLRRGFSDFITIMRGCNRFCSYCIVPYVRGRERSRSPESILEEARKLADDGVKEIMLLGQNVAAYGIDGIHFPETFSPFADLLESLAEIDGIKRIRFTSPHPAFFNTRLIDAIAGTPKVCKSIHLPLQSGSDRILKAMNRPYTAEQYLRIVDSLKEKCGEIAFSTDIIVGFPGETEEDFQQTIDVVRQARFSSAFTFIYSPRPGTPAAAMEQIPRDVVQDRFDRLVALQEQITEENLATFEGRDVEVMITGKLGKKDTDTHRVTGREKTGVLVHIGVPEGEPVPEIGDFVTATVTHAGRHNLLADPDVAAGQTYSVRH